MEQLQVKQFNSVFSKPNDVTIALASSRQSEYSHYLDDREFKYLIDGPYITSGPRNQADTWLIHITIVPQQFDHLIRPLLAFLKPLVVSFKIPVDADQHSSILDGRSGFELTGKAITVFVENSTEVKTITEKIIELTQGIKGPGIPCGYHLTNAVAVEFLQIPGKFYTTTKSLFYGSGTASELKQQLVLNGINWPFGDIRPLIPGKQPRILKRQYIPVETFKTEPKGNVFKALKINRLYNIEWCVIKQGRQYQSFDNSGRDMKNRMQWQFAIHQRFEQKHILPKAIEYFELDGDGFFAMEYKESISLAEQAVRLSEGNIWRSMDLKRQMIGYLMQTAQILSIFHEEGFVHRDVTAGNFIVTEAGQLFAIDIELCYDFRNDHPSPSYTLGTVGYMSPQQQKGARPAIQDDIYSFGALLISMLTGILPNKLNHEDTGSLAESLSWFIDSPSLVAVMVNCLDRDPNHRPTLAKISAALDVYDTLLLTGGNHGYDQYPTSGESKLKELTVAGIHTLGVLLAGGQRTLPKTHLTAPNELNKPFVVNFCVDNTVGYSELIMLAMAINYIPNHPEMIHLTACLDSFLNQMEIMELPEIELQILANELNGKDRNAARMLNFISGTFPVAENFKSDLHVGISAGLAGRGLKLLYLIEQYIFHPDPCQLTFIINRMIELQENDGSWKCGSNIPANSRYKVTGFSHGVAGITYFLLSYYAWYQSEELKSGITRALNWLSGQRRPDQGRSTWTVSDGSFMIDPWLEHGFSGVALTFIKAYEVLGEKEYRQIASEVLSYHPANITSNYCSFGNGLSGLGEIYLEAFRVFSEPQWQERAFAVRDFLLHTSYRDGDLCYWLDGAQLKPLLNFWDGNGGVLHFLLRCARPDLIGFPYHLIQ